MALENQIQQNSKGCASAPVTNAEYMVRQDHTESNARSYPRKFPFSLVKAQGSWIEDVEGNRYLDFLCGAGTLALGHNDPEVNQAMIDLISSNAPLHTLDLMTPTKERFVSKLISLLPEAMQWIRYCHFQLHRQSIPVEREHRIRFRPLPVWHP